MASLRPFSWSCPHIERCVRDATVSLTLISVCRLSTRDREESVSLLRLGFGRSRRHAVGMCRCVMCSKRTAVSARVLSRNVQYAYHLAPLPAAACTRPPPPPSLLSSSLCPHFLRASVRCLVAHCTAFSSTRRPLRRRTSSTSLRAMLTPSYSPSSIASCSSSVATRKFGSCPSGS